MLYSVRIHFNQYSREDLARIVAAFLESDPAINADTENMFRLQYSGLVLSLFYVVTRSIAV